MEASKKKVKYPENLYLQGLRKESGKSIEFIAQKLGVSRVVLSNTINGHYKGTNIVPELLKIISQ